MKTVQGLKMVIEVIKKTLTDRILEMENLGKRTTDTTLTNRTQEIEENLRHRIFN